MYFLSRSTSYDGFDIHAGLTFNFEELSRVNRVSSSIKLTCKYKSQAMYVQAMKQNRIKFHLVDDIIPSQNPKNNHRSLNRKKFIAMKGKHSKVVTLCAGCPSYPHARLTLYNFNRIDSSTINVMWMNRVENHYPYK